MNKRREDRTLKKILNEVEEIETEKAKEESKENSPT